MSEDESFKLLMVRITKPRLLNDLQSHRCNLNTLLGGADSLNCGLSWNHIQNERVYSKHKVTHVTLAITRRGALNVAKIILIYNCIRMYQLPKIVGSRLNAHFAQALMRHLTPFIQHTKILLKPQKTRTRLNIIEKNYLIQI